MSVGEARDFVHKILQPKGGLVQDAPLPIYRRRKALRNAASMMRCATPHHSPLRANGLLSVVPRSRKEQMNG